MYCKRRRLINYKLTQRMWLNQSHSLMMAKLLFQEVKKALSRFGIDLMYYFNINFVCNNSKIFKYISNLLKFT